MADALTPDLEPPGPPALERLTIVAGLRSVAILTPEGTVRTLSPRDALAAIRGAPPPILCHAPEVAKRLGVERFPALDVLELFAFARPAEFCVPTPAGIAAALGLEEPDGLEDQARALRRAAETLLAGLADIDALDRTMSHERDALPIARTMAQGHWGWGPAVVAALEKSHPAEDRDRRATYSPFLPVCPDTGRVLLAPVVATDADAGTITYENEAGAKVETPVTGGHCKLQWKADWAMRWTALGVDYEMSGKDLIDSVRLSSRICQILGGKPPEGFTYELFLDENGEKISKSRGNGLTVDEWLRYAPPESLALYMFNSPRKAKRLYFDVIPRHVDDYLTFLGKFASEDEEKRIENPAWHIHGGQPPSAEDSISFALLLNLASACNTDEKQVLWGFITRYAPDATPESEPILDRLVEHAIHYYLDFVKPEKRFRAPSDAERAALEDLAATLEALPADADAAAIQNEIYEVGKRNGFENLREWFKALYEILLGREQGPRMGSFVALYGVSETLSLIRRVLAGEDISEG
jgi:hypothetical protein